LRFSVGLLALLALLHAPGVEQKPWALRGVWQLVLGKYGS